jgi:hypothetical protein
MRPEGVEPTPYRLKGGYAAITPRPQIGRGRIGFRGYRRTMFRSPQVLRGGIAPAGKRGQAPFAGTARRVLRTNGA